MATLPNYVSSNLISILRQSEAKCFAQYAQSKGIDMSYSRIHPADLFKSDAKTSPFIIDVRTLAEAQAESIPGSINIPLHELTREKLETELAKFQSVETVYLLCQGGRRAEMAAEQLSGHVQVNLCVIDGGMNAVKQFHIPITLSKKSVMSLERQVRIAAGFLVFTGVILGTFINPLLYGLSGFVGAGLMFAGITDTCMMGMLIARMPWNK